MNKELSVIIPAYNRAKVLCRTIESVLAQTVPVSEIIIVNDGSRDETESLVLEQIRTNIQWRSRVRYFYQNNQGQSAAINAGVAKAQCEWLGFSGQDDLWLPSKVEWQIRALEKMEGRCHVCFTDAWFANNPQMKKSLFHGAGIADGPSIGMVDDAARLVSEGKNPIWMQTVIASREVVERAGGHDPFLRYSEDLDILFRMALLTKFCFVSMPMVLIDRSPADDRHVGEARNWHREEYCLTMEQHRFETQLKHLAEVSPETQRLIKTNMSNLHSSWASWALQNSDYEKAKSSIASAMQYGFTPKLAIKRAMIDIAPSIARHWILRDRAAAGDRADRLSWQADDAPGVL